MTIPTTSTAGLLPSVHGEKARSHASVFALTEDSSAFREYAEMLMVAVHTAQKFTALVPHLLYDGGENVFTAWLRKRDV